MNLHEFDVARRAVIQAISIHPSLVSVAVDVAVGVALNERNSK